MMAPRTIILALLLPLAVPLLVQAAGQGDWYVFNHEVQQCELWPEGPAREMALFDKRGEPYTMEDVTEQGQVVQTTMRYWLVGDTWTKRIIFYRGQARCEQDRRAKRQEKEQRRERYR
jgi:hypothetical protein